MVKLDDDSQIISGCYLVSKIFIFPRPQNTGIPGKYDNDGMFPWWKVTVKLGGTKTDEISKRDWLWVHIKSASEAD